MHPLPEAIHTERLVLRPFTIDDAHAYWPLVSNPDVLRYTGEEALLNIEAVQQVLRERPLRDYAIHGFGRMACIEQSSQRLIGFSGLKYLEDLCEVDIGYRFLPEAWGKGYATESASALLLHHKKTQASGRVIGLVEPDNQSSVHVLKKLGLTYEKQIHLAPSTIPLDLYSLRWFEC